jgi:hypothetical protein
LSFSQLSLLVFLSPGLIFWFRCCTHREAENNKEENMAPMSEADFSRAKVVVSRRRQTSRCAARRGGYIVDQEGRGQVGVDLSQRLSSIPARFEGVAIYPPLPGRRKLLSGVNFCDYFSNQTTGVGSATDPGGGTASYRRFNVCVQLLAFMRLI